MTTRAKRSAKSQQIEALIGSDRELLDGATVLLDQERLGDHGARTAGAHQPSQGGDQVNQQDDQVAHRDILAITPRITRLDISTDCGTG